MCDWEMDRQINAGLNILKTALASNEALARAVRFQPGALRDDVVIPLYDLSAMPSGAREEPSGVESHARGGLTGSTRHIWDRTPEVWVRKGGEDGDLPRYSIFLGGESGAPWEG